MMCRDEITLASVSTGRDKDGYPKHTIQMTEVFADIRSVTRQEFYEALRSGWRLRSASRSGAWTMTGRNM